MLRLARSIPLVSRFADAATYRSPSRFLGPPDPGEAGAAEVIQFAEKRLNLSGCRGKSPCATDFSANWVVWAQISETINPVTGLKQQARISLARPEQAYIFTCTPSNLPDVGAGG